MKSFYFLTRLGVLCGLCTYVVLGGCNSAVLYGLKLSILMKHGIFLVLILLCVSRSSSACEKRMKWLGKFLHFVNAMTLFIF